MPRNIEVKARLASTPTGGIDALQARAGAIADRPPEAMSQDDTFFGDNGHDVPGGRLKLRVFGDGSGELISYRRPDTSGPKTSDYIRTPVADPAAMRATLGHALGVAGRVVKERTLLRVGRTRIHLDRVVGLGDFLELEVVLTAAEDESSGVAEAEALLARLGVSTAQLVSGAYLDLLRLSAAADGDGRPAPPGGVR